jgi:hypothetical protein
MMNEKIVDKIKKLLALSESSNPHEAALAAQLAAELMMKHQIDEAMIQEVQQAQKESVEEFDFEKCGGNRKNYRGMLAAAIADFFGCQILWRKSDLIFVGRKSDLNATSYLFKAVLNQIEELCERFWIKVGYHTGQHGKGWKNSFRLGIISEIGRLLQTRKQSARKEIIQSDSRALVVINELDFQVTKFMSKYNIRRGPSVQIHSGSGYNVGKNAAGQVNLGGNAALNPVNPNLGSSGYNLGYKK